MRRAAALFAAGMALLAAAPATADEQTAATPGSTAATPGLRPVDPNALANPPRLDRPPTGFRMTGAQVLTRAAAQEKIREMRREHPGYTDEVYTKGTGRWQVSYYEKANARGERGKEIGQVLVDDRTGGVLEAWTGFQVAWTMARGYPGAFGRKASALYVWIPLCVLFLLPFIDPRRPFRLLHLDLLVLLSFSASLAFFSHGRIDWSVPLAYPPMVYLLVRMLMAGRRSEKSPEPLKLLVPAAWLSIGLVFLVGFRIGLNVTNSNVIDVGYSGVIGADKLVDGDALYGAWPMDNERGDTYGPVNYYAYVPFEQAFSWRGIWDDLPAAHAAAIFFDLLAMLFLYLLGRRARGPSLGVVLAYAWAAFPFTLFVLSSNGNDTLVGALVAGCLLLMSRPGLRGGVTAIAGLTKFAPLGLAPLMLRGVDGPEPAPPGNVLRAGIAFCVAFAVTAAVVLLPAFLGSGLSVFYERTISFQADRGSPFSIWGYHDLELPQIAAQAAAVALALIVAARPRRRDILQVSALAAAVLIAAQLGIRHWFYLYIVWFLPCVLFALLGPYAAPEEDPDGPGPPRADEEPVSAEDAPTPTDLVAAGAAR